MIYGVIENEYFKESEVFANKFLYFCKYNPNKIQFITKETRKEIKQIGLEHDFFHRLCWSDPRQFNKKSQNHQKLNRSIILKFKKDGKSIGFVFTKSG